MGLRKISIIGGAGNIGSLLAYELSRSYVCDEIVVLDLQTNENICKGKSLDISQSASLIDAVDFKIKSTSDYADIKNSSIIIVVAGVPRKPGMTREQLIDINADVIKSISKNISKYSQDSIVIIVTNPLDVMTYLFCKLSTIAKSRIIGMAGVLDSARFSYFLGQKLDISSYDIRSMILGGHSDSMIPLLSASSISGIPIKTLIKSNFISQEDVNWAIDKTRNGGKEIVDYLGFGSAYHLPANSIKTMIKAILNDSKRILNCCAFLNGEYGEEGICLGVPVILGKNGVEKIIEIELDEGEKAEFNKSTNAIKELINYVNRSL